MEVTSVERTPWACGAAAKRAVVPPLPWTTMGAVVVIPQRACGASIGHWHAACGATICRLLDVSEEEEPLGDHRLCCLTSIIVLPAFLHDKL